MKRRLEALPTDEAERRRLLLAMLAEDSDEADESEESEGGEEGEEGEDASDEDGSDDGESDENEALPDLDAEGRIAGYAGIDHSVRSFANALPLDEEQRSALTRDCRLVFALNSSNWLAASAEPRCSLEAVARAIFERHTGGATYDAARSGCEWWAQAQPLPPPPSPPAATTFTYRRSSLTFLSHHHQVRTSGEAAEAIEFHWDCDEYCCDVHDVHVSPVLSSVTYLGDYGAPTLVLAVPSPHSASQDLAAAHGPIEGGTLSYPRVRHRGLEPQASGAQASRLLTRVSLASPRPTSPHLASPRLTSPHLASPWAGGEAFGLRRSVAARRGAYRHGACARRATGLRAPLLPRQRLASPQAARGEATTRHPTAAAEQSAPHWVRRWGGRSPRSASCPARATHPGAS